MAFEIKKLVPAHKDVPYDRLSYPNDPIFGHPKLAQLYYQTDLMVHLCTGITFNELYDGPLIGVVTHMIDRIDTADKLPDHLHKDIKDRRADALTILQNIQTELGGNDRIKLRHFYEERFKDTNTPKGKIAQLWIALEDLMRSYVCTPWVRIQKADSNRPADNTFVPPARITAFLNQIGEYDLSDFYLKPAGRHSRLDNGIGRGRLDRILSRPRPGGVGLAGCVGKEESPIEAMPDAGGGGGGGGGSNNRRCNSTTHRCEVHTGSFCSEDPDTNQCSAASG